jgi:hypothetical protein
MRKPSMHGNYDCAPVEWRKTSDMTGSYELDGMISRTSNKDMADRLENHLVSDVAYKKSSGYGSGGMR